MSTQSKGFCFTINNYTEDDEQEVANLGEDERVEYLVYGREEGEQGTPHLQGFVYFKSKIRWSTVRFLLPRAHLEQTKGTTEQNIAYCTKDGNYEEFGDRPVSHQGRRSDLDRILEWLDEFIATNQRAPTEREVAMQQPKAFLRYRNFMQLCTLRAPPPTLQQGEPKPWQRELEAVLTAPCPSDRDILFYIDEAGGSGKSWFTRWFFTNHADICQLLQPAGYADMAYALDESKTVFLINIARGGMEFLQYRFLESLKDRTVFSTKYESRLKVVRDTPHVVVFTNEQPDLTKMTEDRYNINKL